MSLILSHSSPAGLTVKTGPGLPGVSVGDYDVSMEDFLAMACYVLGNTDLERDDPRLAFVERVRHGRVVTGWGATVPPPFRRADARRIEL